MNDHVRTSLDDLNAATVPDRRLLSRPMVAGALVLLLVGLAVLIVTRLRHKADAPENLAPLVTAVAPGRSPYTLSVSFTGAIVARYDMPIGIDGEGGRVAAVLVEVGDTVHRGQALARLDTSVLAPQVASLRAALEQS